MTGRPDTFLLKEIESADDPDLAALSALMDLVFVDPNTVLGLDRLQEFLATNGAGQARRFYVLVVKDPQHGGAVVGGCVFSYVGRSNCGFSEYMLVHPRLHGKGLGRQLFNARKTLLDAAARQSGYESCRGVFIEVDSPDRIPADLAAAERETALDVWERLRLFAHLGFRRVQAPYVQPPLAPDKQPIDYLDLLFAPWSPDALAAEGIPKEWLFDTLEAIWTAWSPQTAAEHLERLKQRVQTPEVALHDPLQPRS